jgi:hypothetical protein
VIKDRFGNTLHGLFVLTALIVGVWVIKAHIAAKGDLYYAEKITAFFDGFRSFLRSWLG